MNLTKLSIATGVAALVLSASAFAAQPGYFAGASLGYGDTRYSSTTADKTTGVAYGLNGGYNFNQYFGLEGQINRDANAKISGDTVKTYDADVLADGYYPINTKFDLVGKAGFAYVRQTYDGDHDHFYRPKVAAGVSYAVTQNVSTSVTYSRIFEQGNYNNGGKFLPNVDVAAVSVDYLF